MMNTKKIRGTGTAIVTPFSANGEIDYEATRSLLDYQLSGEGWRDHVSIIS